MLHAVEISPDVYWVGGVDWNERNFHGYTTDRGSTYNAYLIMDEHITLIDTCKPGFNDELLERISEICDPSRIEYLIANHVEQDHSGGIPAICQASPDITIYASNPKGVQGFTAHYGPRNYVGVKTGDTLCIGKRTLSFVQTTMIHWPDNMVTYSDYDRILFSNDAFGQHFASSKHFDDEVDLGEVLAQAQKYYANIVMPYSKNVAKALGTVGALDIGMIAPSHGIIWRSHIPEILEKYTQWSALQAKEYAIVVYDSMWHSTEAMAHEIAEAFIESGITTRLFDLKVNHISDIITEVLCAKYVAVGSPTLNSGMMPTVASFLWYLKGLSARGGWPGRFAIAFGSYGWAPMGPEEVSKLLADSGYEQPLGVLTHQWTVDDKSMAALQRTVKEGIEAFNAG